MARCKCCGQSLEEWESSVGITTCDDCEDALDQRYEQERKQQKEDEE